MALGVFLEQEGMRVVGVASSSAEAPRYAEELRAEIILVDIISSAADHSADAADAAVA